MCKFSFSSRRGLKHYAGAPVGYTCVHRDKKLALVYTCTAALSCTCMHEKLDRRTPVHVACTCAAAVSEWSDTRADTTSDQCNAHARASISLQICACAHVNVNVLLSNLVHACHAMVERTHCQQQAS
jgi:hypothetical protein